MYTNHATRSRVTTDHRAIREWVESRGGMPARIKGTGSREDAGLLRIAFAADAVRAVNLEPISWQEFFETFERNRLAFLYREEALGEEDEYVSSIGEEVSDGSPEMDVDVDELERETLR